VPSSGSRTISNISQTTLFSIMCTKDTLSTFDYISVNVNSNITTPPSSTTTSSATSSTTSSTTTTTKLLESGFCGVSTYNFCTRHSDCIISGCSGQVCQSKTEAELPTTCE